MPDPIAVAVDRMNPTWALIPWSASETGTLNLFSLIIKIGAFTGLSSVMLVLCYAQTRVFYQMAKDGLIWRIFGQVNPRFHTPAAGTVVLGVIIAVAASMLPLGVLGDLVSLGTALAFAIVCGSVIYLRRHNAAMKRPFQVPFYPYTPILGIFFCVVLMMGPILLDIVSKGIGVDLLGAMIGNPGTVEHDPIALGILTHLRAGRRVDLPVLRLPPLETRHRRRRREVARAPGRRHPRLSRAYRHHRTEIKRLLHSSDCFSRARPSLLPKYPSGRQSRLTADRRPAAADQRCAAACSPRKATKVHRRARSVVSPRSTSQRSTTTSATKRRCIARCSASRSSSALFPIEMDDPDLPPRECCSAFYRHVMAYIVAPEHVNSCASCSCAKNCNRAACSIASTTAPRRVHDRLTAFLCRAIGVHEPDTALHQLAFSIGGLVLVLFVERTAVDLIAPELLADDAARAGNDRTSRRPRRSR